MARFSRLHLSCLRRSARLFVLAAGFGGISAGHAFADGNSLATTKITLTGKAVACDAYISGFKTLLKTAEAQTEQVQLPLTGGTIPWQVILAQQAKKSEFVINCRFDFQSSLAKTVCVQLSSNCNDTARRVDLDFLSLKFRAEEQIQAAALAHGRELAFNTELCASVAAHLAEAEIAAPTPVVQHHLGSDGLVRIGIDFDITPRIIICEEEEALLGVAAEALETVIQPLLEPLLEEPGLLAISDAAPLDNPPAETNLAEYVPHLPAGDDAPTENPELEASAALVVSPTMAPDEYLAAFQDRIIAQQETNSQEDSNGQILPVAHHEMIQVSDSPALRALGGPINVTPCESETCRGFTIQFSTPGAPAAGAEARVFDGPAQIKLCDTSGSDSGTAEPAPYQESTREESLDEVAARLQRQFLARAMSGEFDQPGACPAENCQPCPGEKSATKTCPPCGMAECPGCPAGSPCCAPAALPTLSAPPAHARSQWTLPTPAVTYNPYAQTAPQLPPGAGFVLPRECDFYFRSGGMELPGGTPPAACFPPSAPTTFAAPQMACGPQPTRPEYPSANSPYPGVHSAAAPAARLPISPESLDTHREISRTLDQLAERCESQGMYDKADQLRELARENRMSARAIHGHLATLPLPQPYAVPAGYYPEPMPMMVPPALDPTLNPNPPPALPIAQPIMVPRY